MTVHELALALALTGRNVPWRCPGEPGWRAECPCCDVFGALRINGADRHAPAAWACETGCSTLAVIAALDQDNVHRIAA